MIIITTYHNVRGGIKPRQIINYDAGIVLIDLHQLNVKTTSRQYKSTATLNTGQPHCQRTNPQNNNRNIRFPNQMIEQINIALEQKGSGNFSAWVWKPAVGD